MAFLGLKMAIRRPSRRRGGLRRSPLEPPEGPSGPQTVEKRPLRGLRRWRISGLKSIWIEGVPIHSPPVDLLLKMEGGARETDQSQARQPEPARARARQTEQSQTDRARLARQTDGRRPRTAGGLCFINGKEGQSVGGSWVASDRMVVGSWVAQPRERREAPRGWGARKVP